jgi:hypothetical protein
VLLARIAAEQVVPAVPVDGLSPNSGNADHPAVAFNEYGRGFVTAAQTQSNRLFAGQLTSRAGLGPVGPVDSQPNSAPPFAAPGIAGLNSMLIAWQESTATGAEIRLRYAPTPGNLGAEQVVSNPLLGLTDATAGLFTGGDSAGDAAAAWVQGSGGQLSVVAAQLMTPPSAPSPQIPFTYSTGPEPVLSWSSVRELWGPVTYAVTVDGQPIARTQSTSMQVPSPLTDGPHTWQVTAINLAGAQSAGPQATVWVDTTPPRLLMWLGGRARIGLRIRAGVTASDVPDPLEPGARASGVSKVLIRWGDGSRSALRAGATHTYKRAGLYRLVATATDRAGNVVTIAHYLRILP